MAGLKRLAEVERRILERQARRGLSGRPRTEACRSNAPSTDGIQTDEGERIMFFKKFTVRKHERGLLFKNGDFIEFLDPGTYRYLGLGHTVERYDLSVAEFRHRLVDYLLETERDALDKVIEVIDKSKFIGKAGFVEVAIRFLTFKNPDE